jgi:hypothetical protein
MTKTADKYLIYKEPKYCHYSGDYSIVKKQSENPKRPKKKIKMKKSKKSSNFCSPQIIQSVKWRKFFTML